MGRYGSHFVVVLKLDNGELGEDVVARTVVTGPTPCVCDLDGELADSFPASDPPSHWPGEGQRVDAGDGVGPARPERVVHATPTDGGSRADPGQPTPRTLPR